MLKIKEEVDLKELEKFGFKRVVQDTYFISVANSDMDNKYETEILINPANAQIKNEIVHYTNNITDLDDVGMDYIDLTSEFDILYDLIQAGLVEKVEG